MGGVPGALRDGAATDLAKVRRVRAEGPPGLRTGRLTYERAAVRVKTCATPGWQACASGRAARHQADARDGALGRRISSAKLPLVELTIDRSPASCLGGAAELLSKGRLLLFVRQGTSTSVLPVMPWRAKGGKPVAVAGARLPDHAHRRSSGHGTASGCSRSRAHGETSGRYRPGPSGQSWGVAPSRLMASTTMDSTEGGMLTATFLGSRPSSFLCSKARIHRPHCGAPG